MCKNQLKELPKVEAMGDKEKVRVIEKEIRESWLKIIVKGKSQ